MYSKTEPSQLTIATSTSRLSLLKMLIADTTETKLWISKQDWFVTGTGGKKKSGRLHCICRRIKFRRALTSIFSTWYLSPFVAILLQRTQAESWPQWMPISLIGELNRSAILKADTNLCHAVCFSILTMQNYLLRIASSVWNFCRSGADHVSPAQTRQAVGARRGGCIRRLDIIIVVPLGTWGRYPLI